MVSLQKFNGLPNSCRLTTKTSGAKLGSLPAWAEPIFRSGVFDGGTSGRLLEMAKSKMENWTTGAAGKVVAVALALFVGVFIFFTYGGSEETQVTQNSIPLAPGNELPIAPIMPPASPPITPPYDNPPVGQ